MTKPNTGRKPPKTQAIRSSAILKALGTEAYEEIVKEIKHIAFDRNHHQQLKALAMILDESKVEKKPHKTPFALGQPRTIAGIDKMMWNVLDLVSEGEIEAAHGEVLFSLLTKRLEAEEFIKQANAAGKLKDALTILKNTYPKELESLKIEDIA